MIKDIEIRINPQELELLELHRAEIAKKLAVSEQRIRQLTLKRRSVDARRKQAQFLLCYRVWVDETPSKETSWSPAYKNVKDSEPVIIIGSGPAGLFAALHLLESGLRPVVLERGKDVRLRRRDIAELSKRGVVDADSNYCFGEGGAGTFSDGKLYTRATKRGNVRQVLERLVYHGAPETILIDSHPHIGTNKLPGVVATLTEAIKSCGGEVLFGERVLSLSKDSSGVQGVKTSSGQEFKAKAVVLATGHSARDIFQMLAHEGLALEAKPFALGVRIEHPQALVDEFQYGSPVRHPNLPAASYSLRAQASDRGVFSFCMCPGGVICPAATSAGEVVVNGWSPSKRNTRFANSGLVVEISAEDLAAEPGDSVFAAMNLQQRHEQRAFELGGGELVAPAQRLSDMLDGRTSNSLPECSYNPGLRSVDLREAFDAKLFKRLQEGLRTIGQGRPGYLTNEAVVVATESRTSSPIRIPRNQENLMHPELSGLFPCGEGAGYAGGIMSAALDGERVAAAVVEFVGQNKAHRC